MKYLVLIIFIKYTITESCENIKKVGQQKEYCINKKNDNSLECIRDFCKICCGEESNCRDRCTHTHCFYPQHDPENILISSCDNKIMGNSFAKFCNSLQNESIEKFESCINGFCNECCFNELSLKDKYDNKVLECTTKCKPKDINSSYIKPKIKVISQTNQSEDRNKICENIFSSTNITDLGNAIRDSYIGKEYKDISLAVMCNCCNILETSIIGLNRTIY
jgi:hypothetical protein